MKMINSLLLLIGLISVFSCGQVSSSKPQNQSSGDESDSTLPSKQAFPSPPISKEDKSIWKDQKANSILYKLGCCSSDIEQTNDCCCKKVVEKYKELRISKNVELIAKIKTLDPIFSGCRKIKKWRQAIEQIDSLDEVGVDEYDF